MNQMLSTMERNRRPPDVEEALSSMLWTPYQQTPSDSSDDENFDTTFKAKSQMKSRFTVSNLYSITEQHLYAKPIRYSNSCTADSTNTTTTNYGHFLPKSYNSLNCELPSYEHIEKERMHRRLSHFFRTSNRLSDSNRSTHSDAVRCNGNNDSAYYNNKNNDTTINNNNSNKMTNPTISNSNDNYNSVTNSNTLDNNSNNHCLSNNIFMVQQHARYPSSMVHSFTDCNLLQYEVCTFVFFFYITSTVSIYYSHTIRSSGVFCLDDIIHHVYSD